MSTFFEIGQYVRSRVNAQGMTKGSTYYVCGSEFQTNFLGTYVTYLLESQDEMVTGKTKLLTVGNGHLVLELV
jgi:hypothetical protein